MTGREGVFSLSSTRENEEMKCSKCGCTFNSGTQVGEDEYLCTSCSTQDEGELPLQMNIYKIIRPEKRGKK